MKKKLLFLLLLFAIQGFSQSITVSDAPGTSGTNESGAAFTQWVNQNLIGTSGCFGQAVSSSVTGGRPFNFVSVGSFANSNPNFAFTRGLVLSTGGVTRTQGSYTFVSSDDNAAWGSDQDFENAFANAGIPIRSTNASVLEFDFTAVTTSLSIDYIFASEEYGTYQCDSKDGMVILIREGSGPYRNIALTPSGEVVSVATIRNNAHNSTCSSENPTLFGQFNGGVLPPGSPTPALSYEGLTVPLTATTTLVPGTVYHIKIVVADDGEGNPDDNPAVINDGANDSAVFFEQGAFNLGQVTLGPDRTIANNNALCDGEIFPIDSQLDPTMYTLVWTNSNNSTVIRDQQSINVTDSGTYTLTINGTCTLNVVVDFVPQIVAGTPVNLYACQDPSGSYNYDLSQNTPRLRTGLPAGTIVTYHASEADAEQGLRPLNSTYLNRPGNETVWARVKSSTSSCYAVVSFELLVVPTITATRPAALTACEITAGGATALFNLTQLRSAILGTQPAANFTVSFFATQNDANAGTPVLASPASYRSGTATLYARVQSTLNRECFAVTPFSVDVLPLPAIGPVPTDQSVCTSYDLPALTNGGNYYSQPGGQGLITLPRTITVSQTIYVYAASTTTPGCVNEASFDVDIVSPTNIPVDVTACTSYTLSPLPAGQEYHLVPNGADAPLNPSTPITQTTTVYFYVPAAAGCTANTSFVVTIISAPTPGDVNVCSPYTLPTLTNGAAYYTAAGGPTGTGTLITNPLISTSQTVWVYNESTAAACVAEDSFDIDISNVVVAPVADVTACGRYTLPTLTVGNYYSASGGAAANRITNLNLTTPQRVYVFAASPTNPACTSEVFFEVDINPVPTAPNVANRTECNSYTLPSLGAGITYFDQNNGQGIEYAPGSVLTQTTTLYATTAPNAFGCRGTRAFRVTIIGATIDTPGTQDVCEEYTLPSLQTGDYYRGIDGTGGMVTAGTVLDATTTLYVYATNGTCTAQDSFTITIKDEPVLAPVSDVVACTSYRLPALTTGEYYTAAGGPANGTALPANFDVTSSQEIFVYAQTGGTPNCVSETSFDVTIITGSIAPDNVVRCGSYRLPVLTMGAYYSSPNGQNPITNTLITAPLSTIYVYMPVTSGPNCTANNSFTVTINPADRVTDIPNTTHCNSYDLPVLTHGTYYRRTGGAATGQAPLPMPYTVSSTEVFFVHNDNATCPSEDVFRITINRVDASVVADQTVCENVGFRLPVISSGNYYTLPGGPAGGGALLSPGDLITTAQTIYVYAELAGTSPICFDEKSFDVIIEPAPAIIAPEPVDADGVVLGFSCGNYILPALTGPGAYYTERDGQGTQLFANDVITDTQTIYIYALGTGTPACASELEFRITVNPQAPDDVDACDVYLLPSLPAGQAYYDAAGGPGVATEIPAGTPINGTTQVYYYIASAASCTTNTFFTVNINNTPVLAAVPSPAPNECDSYTLPALTVGAYYTNSHDPLINPSAPIVQLDPAVPLTTSQTVWVYAETGTFPNCFAEASFDVTITQRPAINSFSNVETCDSYVLLPLTGGNYYTGPLGTGQQLAAGDRLDRSYPEIYIYAPSPSGNADCYSQNIFSVTIYSTDADTILPAGEPSIDRCDGFLLPTIDEGDVVTYTQHYYANPGGPDPDPTVAGDEQTPLAIGTNITQSTTVYIFRKLAGRYPCTDEVAIPINIFRTPDVPVVPNVTVACEEYTLPALPALGNGMTVVTDPTLNYAYYSLPGGPAGGGTLYNENDSFTVTGNASETFTFYLYAFTGTDLCHDESSYTVTVYSAEAPQLAPVTACESYELQPLPLGNYFTEPNGGGTPKFAGDIITATDTLYVLATSGTTPACTDEKTFEVTIVQRPVAITPTPVVACAVDDAGGFGDFDLTAALAESLGTQPDVIANVYETLEDATFNVRPLTGTDITNYRNITAVTQTLYVRLSSTIVECFTIAPLQIRVNPRPIAQVLQPYEICDNGADDTDLIGEFNLPSIEADVLGAGQSPVNFDVEYFETRAEAEAVGGTPIAAPATYTTVSTTIFVKVINIATGCFDIEELELIVNPMPVANTPTPLIACDENAPGDEREEFDLTTKIPEITGGANGVSVAFYYNFDAARDQDAAFRIPDADIDSYTNQVDGVETLFVRVTDINTGCYRIALLDVRVEALPTLTMPTVADLTVCDTDGDGYSMIDLTELTTDMIGVGGADIQVRFYLTQVGAENDLASALITNPAEFMNVIPFAQTIYVRALDTRTGCLSVVYTLNFVINPAPPQLEVELEPLRDCDDDENDPDNQDGEVIFDLTQQTPIILADPNINPGVVITYHATEQAANDGTPEIVTPDRYIGTNEQVIWVRIQNPGIDCYSITSFELLIDTPVDVVTPTMLVLCDEALPNDGLTEFNLTDKDVEILGPLGQGQENVVTYYLSEADADAGNAIPNPEAFTNTVNPQTLTVVVTTIFGCQSRTSLTVKVNPRPTPNFAPLPLEECDDDNPGDLTESFNLRDREGSIRANGLYTIRYFRNRADADAETNEILSPEIENYVSASDTIAVRVDIANTPVDEPVCYEIVDLELIVNPLPFVNPIPVYGICQTNFTGLATFDLDNYRYVILGAGVNLADYTVRYYAQDPTVVPPGSANPSLSYTYRNTNREEDIYVYAENNDTGCFNVGLLKLSVEPQSIANPVTPGVADRCDNTDGVNDGVAVVNLTLADADIIGAQTPGYTVTYYLTLADALAGTNPIVNPSAYNMASTLPGFPIWAEIRNGFDHGCPAYTSFDVIVEKLPEPEIFSVDGFNISCVDFVTGAIGQDVTLYTQYLASDDYSFVWYLDGVALPGGTTERITVTDGGTYTVEVTGPDPLNCPSLPSDGFDVIRSGPASLIGDGYVVSNAFSDNQTITVLVEGYGDYQFSMSENGPWQNSNVFTNVPIGYHTIYIQDNTPGIDPCLTPPIENVSTIDYPKFFTPNNDGYNDYWNIIGLANFPSSQIFIFDRYGKLIKQLSPESIPSEGEGWDGTFNGNPLPSDDYWFTVTFPDGNTVREFKSHFTLKR